MSNTHSKKLNILRESRQSISTNIIKSRISPLTNVSKKILTNDEIKILENGLDYVYPSNKFDEIAFISNIETYFVNLLGHCTDKKDYSKKDSDEQITYNLTPTKLQYASRIRSVCNNFRFKASQIIAENKKATNEVKQVLKNLSKDNSIQIMKPDKGRGIVIMDKTEYNNKMLQILNDKNTFKQLEQDDTLAQEDKLIRKLKQLKNDGFITEKEYNFCRPVGTQPGRIYGLPKIHKLNLPLRPIVSASGTFNFNLAKLLAKKLNHLRKNNSIITNTFDFVTKLHSLRFNPTQIKLVSFDITSLFTKVPLIRTIELILLKMYGPEHTCTYSEKQREDWCTNCKNRYEMKCLLETSTKETHFTFDNKIYSQINGITMGSPLGPLFADIYMNHLENKLMPRLERNGILLWKRFVDDTFVIVDKNADIDNIIEILNSFDPDIVFTCEQEKKNSLPFLDIFITRKLINNFWQSTSSFNTDLYRKSTYTGLITKWDSSVPHSYKVSTLSSMIYRAIKICSSFTLMHKQFQFIRKIAIKNGYPENFIQAQIRKTLGRYYDKINGTQIFRSQKQKNKINEETDQSIKKRQIFIDIPYIGKPTDIFGKRLINLAKTINPQIHVQPISRPSPSISKFFPQKDQIPKDLQSNIVYMINCSNCESFYIGKTIRQASRRLNEHGANQNPSTKTKSQSSTITLNIDNLRRSERNKGKTVNYFPIDEIENNINEQTKETNSAIKQHEIINNHIINWSDWKILTRDTKHYRLLIRESLSIVQYQPILNKTTCSVPLIIYPEGLQITKPKVKIKSMYHTLPRGEGQCYERS
ncbi:unnamed protein product [Rotaria sp. Silwood2]|nr:unnamed protein product [Rotaria sp. Silwood2]